MTNSLFGTYSGYLFEVDGTGRYRILSSGNYSFGMNTLKDWANTNALQRGSVANTLQLIMRGNNLSFYVNRVFLTQLSDTSYSTGQVAFLARSDGSTPADIVYSDLNIYT